MIFKTEEKIFLEKEVPLEGGTSFPVLTFAAWENLPGIRHCFTTRAGGVSGGYLSSLNLRRGLYDPDENVNENFRRIALFFETSPDRIVCAQQTHTSNVRIVTEADAGKGVTRDRDYTDVDGLITDVPGLVLYTSHADCVPIYFYDPVRRVIALAHSGWKGTAARIGEVTIRKMKEIYGCRPEDIYAAIGPSICQDCYEVSEDVAEAMRGCFAKGSSTEGSSTEGSSTEDSSTEGSFTEDRSTEDRSTEDGFTEDGVTKGIFTIDRKESEKAVQDDSDAVLGITIPGILARGKFPGKYQLDLWRACERILLEAGILPDHLTITNLCTCDNSRELFSHRATAGRRGNQGAFLMMT